MPLKGGRRRRLERGGGGQSHQPAVQQSPRPGIPLFFAARGWILGGGGGKGKAHRLLPKLEEPRVLSGDYDPQAWKEGWKPSGRVGGLGVSSSRPLFLLPGKAILHAPPILKGVSLD